MPFQLKSSGSHVISLLENSVQRIATSLLLLCHFVVVTVTSTTQQELKFKNITLKIKINSSRTVASYLITQNSLDYGHLSCSCLFQERALAIHKTFCIIICKNSMGVSFKVVDPVKDPTKTQSTKVDFINGLKCTSRRWGRCIVIKI